MSLATTTFYKDCQKYKVMSRDEKLLTFCDDPANRYALAILADRYSPQQRYSRISGRYNKIPYKEIYLEPYKDFFDTIGLIINVGNQHFFIRYDNLKAQIYKLLASI